MTTGAVDPEQRVRESDARFQRLFEGVLDGVYQSTPDGHLLLANPALRRMLGYETETEIRAVNLQEVYVDPAARARMLDAVETTGEVRNLDIQLRHRNGHVIDALLNTRAVRADDGTIAWLEGTISDVTAYRQLQNQLFQSHKLEVVGRLAGGIAHDFNNLLTVILGYAEALASALPADALPLHDYVQRIQSASTLAAGLTRQLLAFSRRQILQPTVLDVNVVIRSMKPLLARLIREDVRLDYHLAAELCQARIDETQLGQVLLNFAVNARDAMPDGGTMTIATADVDLLEPMALQPSGYRMPPGSYVTITVSDTGTGMDEAVRSHIFEPFFTTKTQGHGTGLGLATVYGIVKQSGGYITCTSAPGAGTTFTVLFPCAAPG